MRKTLLTIAIALTLSGISSAQDFHWSQIQLNPLSLNPAQAGFADKANRITFLYRDQWRSVPVPFSTSHLGYDRKLVQTSNGWRAGAGIQLLYDRAGDGALSTFRPALSLAGGKYFNNSKQLIHLGIQGAYARKQLDIGKLSFDTQFDGVLYDPSLTNGENVSGDNAGYLDLGAGFQFTSLLKTRGKIDIGVSAFNLTKPEYVLLTGTKAVVGIRTMAYTKMDVKLNEDWNFQPGVYFQNQSGAREILIQGLASVAVGKNVEGMQSTRLTFGPGYRTGDAVVAYAGVVWKDLKAGFAFDANISDLKAATRTRGSFELAINYEWEKKKPAPPVFEEEPVADVIPETEEEKEEPVVEETPAIVVKKESTTPMEKIITQYTSELIVLPPVFLFFDNNQPDPGSYSTTTSTRYDHSYNVYLNNRSKFVEEAGANFDRFFNAKVEYGFNQLNESLDKMLVLLQSGKTAVIELKGYASPLWNAEYNAAISSRRIQSIINYIEQWNNGAMKSYLSLGKFVIQTNPVGDTKATGGVSADPNDRKSSVYSTEASFERRVEMTIIRID